MKIVWLINIVLPEYGKKINIPYSNSGGWILGCLEKISTNSEIDLSVVFPVDSEIENECTEINNIKYYPFKKSANPPEVYDSNIEKEFQRIIGSIDPDIVHIYGTEFSHSLSMAKIVKDKSKLIINIQGLASEISNYYKVSVPINVSKRYTLRDFLKRDNLINQENKLRKRGEFEIETLNIAQNVIGRTSWDRACTEMINKNLKYHCCNETLRDEFYEGKWDVSKCEKRTIFLSHAYSVIKGMHVFLKALPYVVERFPDVKVNITGDEMFSFTEKSKQFKQSAYSKYLTSLVDSNNLGDHINFLGSLNASEMKEQFLKANVFVLPSLIENSPNSLGEAMMLGTPIVASNVGGVSDMLTDKKEGYLYPVCDEKLLAYYIIKTLEKEENDFAEASIEHSRETHNRKKNYIKLLEIYKLIERGSHD